MEALAPPVVAVVVVHDPGPWFEEALASLGSQDYAELSVLVLDAASAADVTARVASVLPTAYVRRFEENRGFGATAGEVTSMVEGAAYFLFCHDDVALAPDAVHLLVEEAFRSNAGVVSPKVVSWDDPSKLLHVGMTVDKGGSVVDRVHPHEIDHGQHDAVRDVFVAPGGCTLVRADLFAELGGFDPDIVAMGEDLDLSWRAQVAGARVIVAPDALVRHREELAAGMRALEPSLVGAAGGPADRHARAPVTLQELQRRHELLAVLKCYSTLHLVRVVPQLLVLAVGEVLVAELAGNRARARAVLRAWSWNVRHLRATRARRDDVQRQRRLTDHEVRILQLGGSARLSAYGRRVFQHGFHGAHADELASEPGPEPGPGAPVLLPAGEPRPAVAATRGQVSGRVRLVAWLAATLVVVVGSRGILTGRIPSLGQFVPFPSWTSTFASFAAGWHPTGVGTTAPATPALALAGAVGTVLLGAMGQVQKVLVLGCVPLGVWGTVRLLRPFGSQLASLVAGIAYLAVPLPYDAIALGRWGALAVYAGGPWVLAALFVATRRQPYVPGSTRSPARARIGRNHRGRNHLAGARAGAVAPGRRRPLRLVVGLGVLEAVLVAFVPAAAVVVVLAAVATVAASLALGEWRAHARALWLALGATVVAGLVVLPWLVGVLAAGRGAVAVFGVPTPASGAASWGALLRFAVGPIGDSPLAWGFAVAALVPLVLGRGERFAWAGRLWSIALTFWVVAWLVGRGWLGDLAIDPLVLLGPAAAAVAASIGLGIAAFEEDLRAAVFGWRQVVTVVAAAAAVLGALPTVAAALPGRWDLPQNDFAQAVGWMRAKATGGAFRVLWLGDARALNQGGWSAGRGLAYATSEDGPPDATSLWNAPGPGPTALLAGAVDDAAAGRTDRLGALLAPAGVRYVAVVTAVAPVLGGIQSPQAYPVPADLAPALGRQLDLVPVVTEGGISVYENSSWVPERAAVAAPGGRPAPVVATGAAGPDVLAAPPGTRAVPGAEAVLPGAPGARSYRGDVPAGTVLAALAPAGRWRLTGPGGVPAPAAPSFGWAARYRVARGGGAVLAFDGGPWAPLAVAYQVLAWLAALLAVVGFDRAYRSLVRAGRRRATRRTGGPEAAPDTGSAP